MACSVTTTEETMDSKRRQLLAAGAALAGTTALPGRARAQASRPESASLALGFGVDPPFAPHILGITQGWFKGAGFGDVTTRTFTAGALAGEALLSGDIQLWTPGNLPPISMASNGSPVVVLGTNCVNWNLEKLVVRNDANVNAPEDLYRIKIGLLQGSTSSALLHYLAQHYKLDAQKLQVVNLPPPEQLAGLASGTVQGLICWEPWPHRALATGQAKVVHTGSTSYFAANKGQTVRVSNNRSIWVANQDYVRKNPQAVAAMLGVLLRGQRQSADPARRDETIRIFSEFQKQDAAANRAIWGDYVFNPVFDEAYVEDMERTAAFLESAGRIKKRVHVLDYTYTEPLARIDPALVKVRGRWKP
jgi:ABC-type nitrate/sulfonate/bicarbonate transport system substrate-binding protein